jgi:hypothetical protein
LLGTAKLIGDFFDTRQHAAKTRKMTYREWPNPFLQHAGISKAKNINYRDCVTGKSICEISMGNLMKPAVYKVIFRRQTIPACS